MTRTFTSKLDRLGVNPLPLVLSAGDLCMARPTEKNSAGHSDPSRLYLATYVDQTHAVFFDDADVAPYRDVPGWLGSAGAGQHMPISPPLSPPHESWAVTGGTFEL